MPPGDPCDSEANGFADGSGSPVASLPAASLPASDGHAQLVLIGALVLPIGVHENEHAPAGMPDPRLDGGTVADVVGVLHDANVAPGTASLLCRVIGGAVVDDQNLVALSEGILLIKPLAQRAHDSGDGPLFVVGRQDHAQFKRGRYHLSPCAMDSIRATWRVALRV